MTSSSRFTCTHTYTQVHDVTSSECMKEEKTNTSIDTKKVRREAGMIISKPGWMKNKENTGKREKRKVTKIGFRLV